MLYQKQREILSVYNLNAEEILDAGIIKSASRPATLRQEAQNAKINSAFYKPILMKFQSTWTQTPDSSNWRLMTQNAKIKSAFCKPRLDSARTQTPDSSNWRLMTQNAKIKSAFCKLRPETFTVRNILSEGPEVQSPWASDCLIRAPVIIPKTASGESNILCVKILKGEVLPRRHTRFLPVSWARRCV